MGKVERMQEQMVMFNTENNILRSTKNAVYQKQFNRMEELISRIFLTEKRLLMLIDMPKENSEIKN